MAGYNKGEWSEFYAFLKILEDKKLPVANAMLETENGKFVNFKKIHRLDNHGNETIYDLSDENISISQNSNLITNIETIRISSKTQTIFEKITAAKSNKNRGFIIIEAEELAKILSCDSIKAPSAQKADIVATVLDQVNDIEEKCGFSVKSFAGSAATLLNAGETTNFEYIVSGLDKSKIDEINAINSRTKIQDRVRAILEQGGKLNFQKMQNKTFERNLRKIDTLLPEFLSTALTYSSCNKDKSVEKIAEFLADCEEFQKFNLNRNDYRFKLQQLLISSALGMVPGTLWNGMMKAHGGYIIVRKEGSVICYQAFNRDLFLEYLINNTKFDGGSVSRHKYAKLYQEDGEVKFKLNLQIRFK